MGATRQRRAARWGVFVVAVATGVRLLADAPAPRLPLSALWQEPPARSAAELVAGPGGAQRAPHPERPFTLVSPKTSGTSPGYDVRDTSGRQWSVKLGPEAQSEVTVSRLLWTMGYHQPATYYVPRWRLAGAVPQSGARFRPSDDSWRALEGWSWYDNPFENTQPFRGLIVAQLLFGNWDLKADNNRVYEIAEDGTRRHVFVVRDLGASLGLARQHPFFAFIGTLGRQGTKNDLPGYERQDFVKRVRGKRVVFDYRGVNDELLDEVRVADVVWTCERLSRLSSEQWEAAFRAGGYGPEPTRRFVAKIRARIADGLELRPLVTRR